MKIKCYILLSTVLFCGFVSNAQLLYNNGPYFNGTGTGAGGANISTLYSVTYSMSTFGFGHQIAATNSIADDFIVTQNWTINSFVFYAYQTGSTTASTINDVRFQIWSGPPDSVGSTIIYGDLTTNRLTSSAWSGTYRVLESNLLNTDRPIMRSTCVLPSSLVLTPGTYWLHWTVGGTLTSGPWAPPLTPINDTISGNGKQLTSGSWINARDGVNASFLQGFPFLIYGPITNIVEVVGGSQYSSLHDAIGAAPTGSTINLLTSFTEANIDITKDLTINGNGFNLTTSGLNISATKSLTWQSDTLKIPLGFLLSNEGTFTNNAVVSNNGTVANNGNLINNARIISASAINNIGTYKGNNGVLVGALLNIGTVSPGN